MTLRLRAIAWSNDGSILKGRTAVEFEVDGLPVGEQALIAQLNGGWKILRSIEGRHGTWHGHHETAEAAFEALAGELQTPSKD